VKGLAGDEFHDTGRQGLDLVAECGQQLPAIAFDSSLAAHQELGHLTSGQVLHPTGESPLIEPRHHAGKGTHVMPDSASRINPAPGVNQFDQRCHQVRRQDLVAEAGWHRDPGTLAIGEQAVQSQRVRRHLSWH